MIIAPVQAPQIHLQELILVGGILETELAGPAGADTDGAGLGGSRGAEYDKPDKGDNHPFHSKTYLTIPLKPIKAIARMPTVISAIGTPLKAFGTSFIARCSRRPAKMTIASP